MKAIKNFVAVIALATVSFSTLAATEVQHSAKTAIGSVSATAMTLDGLQASLSDKASAAGASEFRIITTTGSDNQLRGVAAIYQ
ncbi:MULTISPECIES: YdgH/BhsA/McbA-like domain containing protein [Dickeya]|uniref:Outer membrane protein n=1 Tax=Dickeya aquatica TaxID=1401087 RepID=A0A375AGD8_9GAMM|nr:MULTISPECIES: YdgH/BhsA/McbA-like domain containing protein [Dickeya]SLM65150.1 Putative outer membrane protein [Dickeya aquatica]